MRLRRVAACGLALLLVWGCQSPEEQLAEHRQLAEQYIKEGKAREAILELRAALQVDPKNGAVCYRLGFLYEASGDLQQAYFFFLEATRLSPENMTAKLDLARLSLGDDPKEARRLTQEVLDAEPKNAQAWSRMADVLLVEAEADEALAAVLTAMELSPGNADLSHQLGRVHEARFLKVQLTEEREEWSILEEALVALDKAVELYAETPRGRKHSWYGLEAQLEKAKVLALWPDRRLETADAYRRAIERAGGGPRTQKVIRRALAYARRRDPELVREALTLAVQERPGSISHWLHLAEASEGEQPAAGREVLDRMLAVQRESGTAWVAYAKFLTKFGAHDDAIALLAEGEADPVVEPKSLLAAERGYVLLAGKRDLEGAHAVAERLEASDPDGPDTALLKAQIALAEMRPWDAVELLEPLLDRGEAPGRTRRLIANAYYQAGDRAKAAGVLEEALAGRSDDTEMLRLQAHVFAAQGFPLDCIRSLQKLRRERPLTASERVLLAESWYGAGRPERGRRIFERVLPGRNFVALSYARQEAKDDPALARRLLEEAYPNTKWPEAKLGMLVLLTGLDLHEGKAEAALDRINKLIEAGTGGPEIGLARAKVLLAMRRPALAERDLLAVIEQDSASDDAYNLLVQIYTAQGRTDEAIGSFEEAAKAGVLTPEAQVVLARLYVRTHDEAKAREAYEGALAQRADLPLAKNDLAYLMAEAGQTLDRALTLAQEARAALPDDPNTADTLGWVYMKRDLAESALFQFQEAVSMSRRAGREVAILHYHLGLALRAVGRTEEAREAFESALQLDPEFSEAKAARQAVDALVKSGEIQS